MYYAANPLFPAVPTPRPDPVVVLGFTGFASMAIAIAAAVVAEITAHAVVNPGTMAAGGDAVTGTGTIS
jgi:D-arabinose 1-dehydrogenase-like Zn-dependent alcohol dehydrogenase